MMGIELEHRTIGVECGFELVERFERTGVVIARGNRRPSESDSLLEGLQGTAIICESRQRESPAVMAGSVFGLRREERIENLQGLAITPILKRDASVAVDWRHEGSGKAPALSPRT